MNIYQHCGDKQAVFARPLFCCHRSNCLSWRMALWSSIVCWFFSGAMCLALFQQATMMSVVHDGFLADLRKQLETTTTAIPSCSTRRRACMGMRRMGIPTALGETWWDTFQDVHSDASLVQLLTENHWQAICLPTVSCIWVQNMSHLFQIIPLTSLKFWCFLTFRLQLSCLFRFHSMSRHHEQSTNGQSLIFNLDVNHILWLILVNKTSIKHHHEPTWLTINVTILNCFQPPSIES